MHDSLTRRDFARRTVAGAAAFASIAILRSPARAADFSLKFANDLPPDHPTNIAARDMAAKLKDRSHGKIELAVFPANQLGNDTQMLSQLRSGAIDFMAIGDNILATLVPAAAINNVGFAWPNASSAFRALDGDLGAYVRGEIEKAGVVPMRNIWDEGFREMTSATKPLHSPEDLVGFKMRVPPSPISTSLFAALGAAPTTINLKDLYSALETHVVDGQENPFALIETQKFYEVQKFCSVTDHMFVGYWVLANADMFKKLPKDLQSMVADTCNETALTQRTANEKADITTRSTLSKAGLQIIEVDRKSFQTKLQQSGFYKQMKEQFGSDAWALLEKHVGSLA